MELGSHRVNRTGAIYRWRTLVTAGVSLVGCSVWACCGVGPSGKAVVFGDQTNIVIWDEANGTEHFIRNASFTSGAKDFGFIAPTPTKPELHEASAQAFYTLASLAPRTRSATLKGAPGGAGAPAGSVQVIQEADVAGYHATTLLSTDARAIRKWLGENGYVSTADFEKWARHYTSKRWYLTAFKVIDRSGSTSTGTVRMSFKTDRPFNPFYVPSSNIANDRRGTLRLYFVAAGDYEAMIGDRERWRTPLWSAAIPDSTAGVVAKQVELPVGSIPQNAQVQTYVDNNFPRPASDDIYFVKSRSARKTTAPATSPNPIKPPVVLASLLCTVVLFASARRVRRVR